MGQALEEILLAEMRVVEIAETAMAEDDLILGPFDRFVEQGKVAQHTRFAKQRFQLPVAVGSALDAGQHRAHALCCKVTDQPGQHLGRCAGNQRDAAQVQHEEQGRFLREDAAGDVIDIGEGERARQFENADRRVMSIEQLLIVRLAAAPPQSADIVVGDDAGAHIVGAVEHMQIEMRR